MAQTITTIIGNVATNPEAVTTQRGTQAVTFRLAQTQRRFNPDINRWEDGNTSWYQVTCWREWSENVVTSIALGDPVIVVGKLKIREWQDQSGLYRTRAEIDAITVGHDGRRGIARFKRIKRERMIPVDEHDDLNDAYERHAYAAIAGPWDVHPREAGQPVEQDADAARVTVGADAESGAESGADRGREEGSGPDADSAQRAA